MGKKNAAAVALGARGGAAGKGKAKRRGDSAYYAALVAKRRCAKNLGTPGECTRRRGHAGPCWVKAKPGVRTVRVRPARYYVEEV